MQRYTTQTFLNRARLLLEEARSADALQVLQAIVPENEEHRYDVTYLLGWYYILSREWQEATHMLSPLLPPVQIEMSDRQQEVLLERELTAIHFLRLGQVAVKLAHFEDASQHFALCLRLLRDRRVYFPALRVEARYNMAKSYLARDSYRAAIQHYDDALRLCRHYKLPRLVPAIYRDLSEAYERLGEFKKAQESAHEALRLYQENNNDAARGYVYHTLGHVHFLLGEYAAASSYYTQSLALTKDSIDSQLVARNYTALAEVALQEQHIDEAKAYMLAAETITENVEDAFVCGRVYAAQGNITLAEAHLVHGVERERLLTESLERFQKAVHFFKTSRTWQSLCEVYNTIATVAEELGRTQDALVYCKLAYLAQGEIIL